MLRYTCTHVHKYTHTHTQIDDSSWCSARRFRLIAADGQSRVFAVDCAADCAADAAALATVDGQYGQWVRALARVALANLEEALDRESAELRSAAERDSERIAESRRIQASSLLPTSSI